MRRHLYADMPLLALAGGALLGGWPLALPAIAAAWIGVHVRATVHPRSSLYLPVQWRFDTTAAQVALTYDDGPHPDVTPALLDLLGGQGQRATFFVIGEHVRRHPALVRRIHAEGHALGLHSDHHDRTFACWSAARIRRDLETCAAAIADATGAPPPRIFRPPVGMKSPPVGSAVRALDLLAVTWTRRGFDTGTRSAEQVARRLVRGAKPGDVLVLHDGHEPRHPATRTTALAASALLLPMLAVVGLHSVAVAAQDGRLIPAG